MLSRDPSPNLGLEQPQSPVTVVEAAPAPPPSQVVMRYWNQCSSTADSGYFGEESMDQEDVARDENGDIIPPWKADAIEGEEQSFPSIADKIKQMEEEAKKPLAMYEVPDVKSKMKTGAPAAKWMEARGKLQQQLDTLITKTSEKMSKYGSVHARVKEDFVKDSSAESEGVGSQASRPASPKEVVDKQVKKLIKTVANEIQKSFSMKSVNNLADEEDEDEEEEEEETEEEKIKREEEKQKRLEEKRLREEKEKEKRNKKVIRTVKKRQKQVDMEAPILDFELKEPTPEPEPESEEDDCYEEAPIDFDTSPAAINLSAAKTKIDMGRKTSTGKRLPASILAKKKAAEKAKAPQHADASTSTETPFTDIEVAVAAKLKRKEMFSDKVMQTQWEISNADYELSKLSDNEKADLLSKQISKMKGSHVNKLLKNIDSGVLDISVPLLIPFLSLQARMSLGTNLHKNRFKAEDAAGKHKMVKESFVDMMIKDITDIALLQEVIERSQEKLQILAAEDERRFAEKLRQQKLLNIENDSFELGSSPPKRCMTPLAKEVTPVRSETPLAKKETTPEVPVCDKNASEESRERTTSPVSKKEIEIEQPQKKLEEEDVPYGVSDVVSENEDEGVISNSVNKESADEGCPTSESDDDDHKKKACNDVESDEGIGKSDDNIVQDEEEETKDEAPKENQIKQKILNIINDAKTMDKKRNIRNFGRTFEFQGVKEQLKPVLPNDRRPAKAKKLDCLWMNVTASKQKYNEPQAPTLEELKARKAAGVAKKSVPTLEELKNKPKSSVPWTRKVDAQPAKKEILAADKEVKEFESQRKTLKDVKTEAAAIGTANRKSIHERIEEQTKEKLRVEPVNPSQSDICKTADKNVTQEPVDILPPKNDVKEVCKSVTANGEADKVEVKAVESSPKVKVSELKEASQERVIPCDDKSDSETSEVEWEVSEDEEEVKPTKNVLKEMSPEKPKIAPKPVIAMKEIPSLLLMSPAVRRRGEVAPASTSVTVTASIRLPPPPSCRPPPPPISPPVPATKAKQVLQAEEEEESEWEYETESEEE